MVPILALPPPIFLPVFLIGLGVVVVAATAFVGLTRRPGRERDRRAGLGLAALIAGPLVGLAWALGVEATGEVSPLDAVGQRVALGGLGLLVGVGAGLFFAITAALARNEAKSAKPHPHDLD